ncbi:MAG: sensor histidine kinase [Pirellulales bacterium]|nr:sensor histidine kinase [Pirellulales bacterium]
MDDQPILLPIRPQENPADLGTVLTAWHEATLRLEQTHLALQAEVRRLTDELEKKNRELARKNRLADLGQTAVHVANEVRNNLVPATLYLSLLRRRLSEDAGSLSIVEKITAGLTTLEATVGDLLYFTADRDPQRRPFRLRELVEEICAALAPQCAAQGISVVMDVPLTQCWFADREMIRRAIRNLAVNALDAIPQGGSLTFTAAEVPGFAELEIADTGPGIFPEVQQRVFEPFYTTKPDGTGLGLAIVSRIVEVHGGAVAVANCPEGGAAFTVRIPREIPQEAAA